jgi:hypothetical protein
MNAHLGNTFADGFAIAEVAQRRAKQTRQNSGFCLLVGQTGQQASKSDDRSNVFKSAYCIRVDTIPQAGADAAV